jgi:hypothetical protein
MEENKIKVYVQVNEENEIVKIHSNIFIDDLNGWIYIDEGFGDKYALAQGNYFDKPLQNEDGTYNYKLVKGKILEV